jgi:hypothetical protein
MQVKRQSCAVRSTVRSPQGYTLAAFSWFIDQTIAGAVATGTHGSTLQHGSLSSQALPHPSDARCPLN